MCHCRNCKQGTGAAYALSMLTFRKDFQLLSGETISRELPGGSGALHRQHICPACLTRTHTEMLAYPEIINVRPGTSVRRKADRTVLDPTGPAVGHRA